jgi:hypothetical protein
MENNPFSGIINMIREDSRTLIPVNYRLGTVISTAPIIIEVAGTSQDAKAFLKNDTIIDLETGDILFLVPIEDEQRYIIICKVVEI